MEVETIKALLNAESVIKGTTLLTIYLPSNSNIWLATEHINPELKTTANIKNKNVSRAVTNALKSVLYKLKTINKISEYGMVICAGEYGLPIGITQPQYL